MKHFKKSVGVVYIVVGTLISLGVAMSLQRNVTISIPSEEGGYEMKIVGKEILLDGRMILKDKIILESSFGDVTISKENKKVTVNLPSKSSDYELEIHGKDVIYSGDTISNVKSIGQTSFGNLFILTEKRKLLVAKNN